jgi:hypothetical protein
MPTFKGPKLARFLLNDVPCVGTFREDVEQNWANDETMEPDPEWSFLDSNRHFHAVDTRSGDFLTLASRTVHTPCDGSCDGQIDDCDGYSTVRFSCQICGEQIEPRFKTAKKLVLLSQMQMWEATVRGPFMSPGLRVTVRIDEDGMAPRFGIAVVTTIDYESSQEGVQIELAGSGALGYRPAISPQGSNE